MQTTKHPTCPTALLGPTPHSPPATPSFQWLAYFNCHIRPYRRMRKRKEAARSPGTDVRTDGPVPLLLRGGGGRAQVCVAEKKEGRKEAAAAFDSLGRKRLRAQRQQQLSQLTPPSQDIAPDPLDEPPTLCTSRVFWDGRRDGFKKGALCFPRR